MGQGKQFKDQGALMSETLMEIEGVVFPMNPSLSEKDKVKAIRDILWRFENGNVHNLIQVKEN